MGCLRMVNSWHISVAAESITAFMFARIGYDVSVYMTEPFIFAPIGRPSNSAHGRALFQTAPWQVDTARSRVSFYNRCHNDLSLIIYFHRTPATHPLEQGRSNLSAFRVHKKQRAANPNSPTRRFIEPNQNAGAHSAPLFRV